jgi:hypothetical protein
MALLGARGPHEATVATNLRKAGAVLLGKANMSEWADWRCDQWLNGWSPRGGQSWGVYYKGMDPEGSSSGSGVASALGLAFASVGTEVWSSRTKQPANMSNQQLADRRQYCKPIREEQHRGHQNNCCTRSERRRHSNLRAPGQHRADGSDSQGCRTHVERHGGQKPI